MTTVTNSLN